MHKYFSAGKITTDDFSFNNVTGLYDQGYVFTRIGKGVMNKTRSLRIDLTKFSLTSENKRVLKHTSGLYIESSPLPLSMAEYDYSVQKLAKDFYARKFGVNIFSANKTKKLLTDDNESNFSTLLKYSLKIEYKTNTVGYCIAYINDQLLHYCYPFYDFIAYPNNYGLGMMINTIEYAKTIGCRYCYLGSATRTADKYKLDFTGLEWFDIENSKWCTDIAALKVILMKSA